MNKYKVGDKIVLTVSDVNEKAYYSYYVFNNNDLILWEPSTDKYAEPLSTYTEPLEAKIRRQAAEITRLLEENKRLKAENGNVIWEIEQAEVEGAEAAWELARKLSRMEIEDKIQEAFNLEYSFALTVIEQITYPEAAAKVAQWEKAKEKPQKTMMQDFLEKYPKAYINPLGAPPICPHNLGYKKQNCVGDCLECWSRPLEQIGGEE